MKAIVLTKYGAPHELQLQEIAKPVPKENEVLVKIRATAVNDYDWSLVRGEPYLYRLMYGIIKPKIQIPGMELAGTIEALGSNAKAFKIGDAVYGDISGYGFGSFAEYICVAEKALINKPEKMSFQEAASIPHAALLAFQGLYSIGKMKRGQKILINGAGGGVGTFALQLAKLHSCEVTGVDSGDKIDLMKSLGFDYIIDYKKEDFTKNGEKYDLILDCKSNRSPFSCSRPLKINGTYVTIGGELGRLIQILLFKKIISLFFKKNLQILALKPNKGLDYINSLYLEGKIKCTIDGPYTLEDVPKLIQYFGEGKHKGKVVISL